jgi:hypothetical protein
MPDFADSEPAETSDEILARAIAMGCTRTKAAQLAGLSIRTVYNRMLDPAFTRTVAKFRRIVVDGTVGRLARHGERAAAVLARLLADENPGTRLRAAVAILQQLVAVREHGEIVARLDDLEQRLAHDYPLSPGASRNGSVR